MGIDPDPHYPAPNPVLTPENTMNEVFSKRSSPLPLRPCQGLRGFTGRIARKFTGGTQQQAAHPGPPIQKTESVSQSEDTMPTPIMNSEALNEAMNNGEEEGGNKPGPSRSGRSSP